MTISFIFSLIVVAYLVYLTFYLVKLKKHYHGLVDFTGKDNLTGILDTILDKMSKNGKEISVLKQGLEDIRNQGKNHIQKIGFVRYNPFSDIGGDQSFVFALLDDNRTGVVLRSLHNRNTTRWFAKNVKSGKGVDYELTKEEEKAVILASEKGGIN